MVGEGGGNVLEFLLGFFCGTAFVAACYFAVDWLVRYIGDGE
jgi:hypothetical protein